METMTEKERVKFYTEILNGCWYNSW